MSGGERLAARVRALVDMACYGHSWRSADVVALREARHRVAVGAAESNLERGPGGIADIEAVVQLLQVVHGAADPRLRTPRTAEALLALHGAGHLATEEHAVLAGAERRLRLVTARLWLVGSATRHEIPVASAERRRLAHLVGVTDAAVLGDEMAHLTAAVRRVFEQVFDRTEARLASG